MRNKAVFLFFLFCLFVNLNFPGENKADSPLDKKVKKFLDNHRYQWPNVETTIVDSSYAGISVSYKKSEKKDDKKKFRE
jgi:hypothetical protein